MSEPSPERIQEIRERWEANRDRAERVGSSYYVYDQDVADLLSALAAAEQERDRLGNELAQERARPGGQYDQTAYEQLADHITRAEQERDDLRAKLDAARRTIKTGNEEWGKAKRSVTRLETALRKAVADNEQGPDFGWTHPEESADDLRRRILGILSALAADETNT